VVRAVENDPASFGIVAIENSLEGPIIEVMDAILATKQVSICGEIVLPIEQNLIAAPGTRMEDIHVVMSHTAALGQCRGFLESNMPDVRVEAALSTADAVEEAVRSPGTAALGTKRAAELHGGVILAESIQDVRNNKTRFFVLAGHDAEPTGDDKTSIAFSVANRPGSLVNAMRHLSDRGLNLTRIESRPSREVLGEYVFLIDFQGHRTDRVARDAIAAMQADGAILLPSGQPLGSYPRFRE
jgi:prephenate dehydratase